MPDWWNEAAWTHTWWMALGVGIAAGAFIGLINGLLIAYVGLPPFVVTLGMLSVAHGLAEAVAEYDRLIDVYPSLGYAIHVLPKVSVAERANWILASLAR
jgi:ribose transport system permease protein